MSFRMLLKPMECEQVGSRKGLLKDGFSREKENISFEKRKGKSKGFGRRTQNGEEVMALAVKDLGMERNREFGGPKVVSKTPKRFAAGKFSNAVANTVIVMSPNAILFV